MWFLDKRVQVICDELKRLSVVRCFPVTNLQYKEGRYFRPQEAEEAAEPWKEFSTGIPYSKWYGPDRHYWFRAGYQVPEELEGKQLRLKVRTQIDEGNDMSNPQFLLFVDGEVTQGMDMNHRTARLTSCAVPGTVWQFDLQAYTGSLHSEFDLFMEIQETDPAIEKLYYDLQVPLWGFSRMEKEDKVRIDLETVLNEAVNLLDLRMPYSESFYRSIAEAEEYLEKKLYREMGGWSDVIATCIGHTHIDVAWLWTVEQTREKAARSFSTVLKLMEEYPNYRFMSSQPQLYQFLKERYPEVYDKIKERVREGRWEPEGGMWLEADTNLTSGESLVRQFLYGKRFFREEFGCDNRILWLPDVFGYTGALPQIMKKCGIDYFMTIKLTWNQTDKIPYDTFRWKGIDGTDVLTHFITTMDIGLSTKEFITTYNGHLHPDALMGAWERYQNKDINNDVLISYGYGDGGGGPTEEMLETSLRMERGIRGLPKVRQAFAGTYFRELEERVKNNRRLPVWEGELYFEYHRGTYTSMARNKRSNRKSEFLMMNLELLAVLAQKTGIPYPKEELDRMWTLILRNQFHDILPGSAIREVYEVTKKEYQQIRERGEQLLEERMKALAGAGNALTIFNTLGFERSDLVRIPGRHKGYLTAEDGRRRPVQPLDGESIVYVEGLPSKGKEGFYLEEAEEMSEQSPFHIERNVLETPFYRIELDEQGLFCSVYDRKNEREVLTGGKKGNLFRMYEDKPMNFDNWDIDIYYTEKSWDLTGLDQMKWIAQGPVCAVLYQKRSFCSSVLEQKIYFYADTARIDFETHVDWKENQHLLKVHFPMDLHTDEAAFDIQFGNLTRKIHTNTSWDTARFETCGHKWADLSEGHYGVSLLNDCKYGHSFHGTEAALTLIKSGNHPNPDADREEHFFTYSLYPHAGSLKECDTVRQGYCLNVPALCVWGGKTGKISFAEVDRKNVMLETIKAAEDGNGVIFRLYEYENARTRAELRICNGWKIASVQECNLLEEPQGEELQCSQDRFTFEIHPYEIKTYRVIFENGTV